MQLFDYEKQHIDLLRGSPAECTLFLSGMTDFLFPCREKSPHTETVSVTP